MAYYSGLPQTSSIVLLHDYTKGTLRDYGPSTSNDGTFTAPARWSKSGNKFGVQLRSSGSIDVAHNTTLCPTVAMTALLYMVDGFDLSKTGANQALLDKKFTSEWGFVVVGTTLRFYFSAVYSGFTFSAYNGCKTVIATLLSGGFPLFYTDGVYRGLGTDTLTMSQSTNALKIGSNASGHWNGNIINVAAIWNGVALSTTEVLQAHNWCLKRSSPLSKKSYWTGTDRGSFSSGRELGCVGSWDCRDLLSGTVVDSSSNAKDGTAVGYVETISTVLGKACRFGSSYLDIGDTTQTCKSFELIFKPNGNEKLIDLDGGTHVIEVSSGNLTATGFSSPTIYLDGSAASASVVASKWYHAVITTSTGFAVSDLDIGRQSTNYFSGLIKSFSIYTDTKDTSFVSNRYKMFAKQPTYQDDCSDYLVSVAVEGGSLGQQLSNSPWKFGDTTGRYSIIKDTIDGKKAKSIQCNTAGLLYQELTQAYGTWEFSFRKSATGVIYFCFIADTIGGPEATGQDGYSIAFAGNESVYAFKSVNGVAPTLFYNGANYYSDSTWYRVCITRSSSGLFSFYIKGGSFTSWTLIAVTNGNNPVSDTTTTTSKYVVFDIDANDRISGFNFYQGEVNPTTL